MFKRFSISKSVLFVPKLLCTFAFTKKQLLLTFNSFISNNEDYYKNLNEFEKPLKLKQFKVIDSLNKLNKIITGENEIQKELAKLIQNEKLIIINESHWKPNHRLFFHPGFHSHD